MHHLSGLQEDIPDNTHIPGQQRQTMERRVRGAGGAAKFLSGRRSLPGFSRGLTGALRPGRLPSCLLTESILSNILAAKVNRALAGDVITDFVDHLFGSECRLSVLTAAGIDQRFVLAKNFTGFWRKFHRYTP